MCAITGIISPHNPTTTSDLLRMSNAMILRGPDEGGVFINGNVGLAHHRLSIIDLSTGSQPIYPVGWLL
jgi:asparagine synthase (glutamine-hydrolysing)